MNIGMLRWIVFSFFWLSIVLPTYLTVRLHLPECLWLYAPIMAFWTNFIYDQIDDINKRPLSNEQP